MTGRAMPVTIKTGRIGERLSATRTWTMGMVAVLVVASMLGAATPGRAADAPAPSSAPGSARAGAVGAQVEAALAAADGTSPTPPASAPASAPARPGGSASAVAAPTAAPGAADTRSIDESTQQLKKDVVDLNRDLFVLEEELLFPANTQVAVYVSMDVGEFFALDSITLKIDNKEVTNYLYTPREVDALLKGGVQRLYLGNLKVGSHELVAFFSGKGPNNRDYRRGATLRFDKSIGAKYLELKIEDRERKLQPEFEIRDSE